MLAAQPTLEQALLPQTFKELSPALLDIVTRLLAALKKFQCSSTIESKTIDVLLQDMNSAFDKLIQLGDQKDNCVLIDEMKSILQPYNARLSLRMVLWNIRDQSAKDHLISLIPSVETLKNSLSAIQVSEA